MSKEYAPPVYRLSTHQEISASGTSAAITNAVGAHTQIVRIHSTIGVYLAIGGSPTATTNDPYLPAGTVEFLGIMPGEKVAVITDGGSGTCGVTEMTK